MVDILQTVQTLQFTDRHAAEALLLSFVRDVLGLDAHLVKLRPLAVSLNSFNGFLTMSDGTRLFFKSHTEADTIIGEYYHTELLAQAGYPIMRPVFRSVEVGKQFLLYPISDAPSVFDLAWTFEQQKGADLEALALAQHEADEQLFKIYCDTLEWQTAEQAASAPIHQLFYHRLTGGRLDRFYGIQENQADAPAFPLPGGQWTLSEIRQARWIINGQIYSENLDMIIDRSVRLLCPDQAGPSIIGHGDAHNGNVFFQLVDGHPTLVYFDPAFAGRHHPLLDLVKPLFHNVFAMWMYFPHEKRASTSIQLEAHPDVWEVRYEYNLHPVRQMFLRSKVESVLKPILRRLQQNNWLRPDWRAFLKAALFCCPFLTLNLMDCDRFPPEIRLLGLAMSVEMGAESIEQRSLIDQVLDAVAADLGLDRSG